MDTQDVDKYCEKIDTCYKNAYKVINSLILYSKRFCENLATPDGLTEYLQCLIRGKAEKASKSTYIYEFDYFVMTKSTKTLMAIRRLLNNNKLPMNEDIFILVRSLLENYIIFYSQNYSYKIMKQSAGRIDRLNTPFKDLYYYHLKSRSGIDLGISRSLKDKKDFNETKFVKWSGNTPSKTAA